MTGAIGIGTVLQVVMVVVGHYLSPEQQSMLFPIVGSLLGGVTGWLAKATGTMGAQAGQGAIAGGIAGALGSLVSTALGDAPASNVAVAGGATVVTGAIGAILRRLASK